MMLLRVFSPTGPCAKGGMDCPPNFSNQNEVCANEQFKK